MVYRLYCGIAATKQEYLIRKACWIARSYNDLDDALGFALQMESRPSWPERPWEIEGDGGTQLDRTELIRIICDRRAELVGRPKVF